MAWATTDIQIGDVVIDLPQAMSVRHAYADDEGGTVDLRAASGALKRRSYWTRITCTLEGEGYTDVGLSCLDWTQPQIVKCGSARSLQSPTNTATLPSARRTDAAVTALALVDGYPVLTPVTLAGDTATATPVAGAYAYTFSYYPQFLAYVKKPESVDRASGKRSWSVVAREI